MTPCRVADTRNSPGPYGGPSIAGNTTRAFNIPGGACNVPSTAQAYSLNVGVVPTGMLGFLAVWPTGQPQPGTSTLNSDGRVKSNAVIVAAGTGGSVSVYASNTTDVFLDIDGYFVPTTGSGWLAFYLPVTPCRIVDTRGAPGPLGGPSPGAGLTRMFPIQSTCGMPASAQAYSLNFTVVPPGALWYIDAWPDGQPMPEASVLNAPTGTVVANAAIVPAGVNGSIDVYASNATDLIIDVDGYFAPMGAGGLSLYTVTPCRALDTGSSVQYTYPVNVSASPCAIPTAAQADVLNATVAPPGALNYLALWEYGQAQPLTSTLNAADGAVTSNMAIVQAFSGWIDAYASNPTRLILDASGYFAAPGPAPAPLTITSSATLAPADLGAPYSVTLSASGGVPPYRWSLPSGSVLPSGLGLSSSGNITGNPGSPGTFQFTVQVSDTAGASVQQQLGLTVLLPTLSINGGSSSYEVGPWTTVSLAFSLYDQANGANDIGWAQFYLADSSGNGHCYGDWGRPNGLDLYDGNTGTTLGFGINQSDSFCTVSLASITNSSSDPTEVTVVLNFSFNPGPGGAYTVLTQVNYDSWYAGPWEDVGTLIIEPATEPATSPTVYQPPAQSAPPITPPAPVSASVSMCGDISNTWTLPGTIESMTLNQSGSSVSGSGVGTSTYFECVDGVCTVIGGCPAGVNYSVSGNTTTQGSFSLTALSSSTDNCGVVGATDQETFSATLTSCSTLSMTAASTTVPTSSQMRPQLAQAATTWTATSSPPGITLTVDLMAGKLKTQLTGPKTDGLTVSVYNSQGNQMLSVPHNSAQGGNSFSDSFRTLLQVGQYGSVTAMWGATGSVTVPVTFYMLGLTHVTQYNTPYHSSCPSNPQPAMLIWAIDSQNNCYYEDISLGSAFMSSVTINGTGVWNTSVANTVLKAYYAGGYKICPLYPLDVYSGGPPYFPYGQTFFEVDTGGHEITTITGANNQPGASSISKVLSDATGTGSQLNNSNPPPGSLATDPNATPPNGTTYLYGDAVLLVDRSDTNDPRGLRSVQDLCAACTGQAVETGVSSLAHIDLYNGTSQSCNAHSVGDYVGSNGVGQWYAIRLR